MQYDDDGDDDEDEDEDEDEGEDEDAEDGDDVEDEVIAMMPMKTKIVMMFVSRSMMVILTTFLMVMIMGCSWP